MPIKEYLSSAASQLRRAAVERQQEVDQIRSTISHRESDVSKYHTEMEQQIRIKREQMRDAERNDDKRARDERAREILQLEQELKDTDRQLDKDKQDHGTTISDMMDESQQLIQKADEIDRWGASAA